MNKRSAGTFPFGEPVWHLRQEDRGPKSIFVLGVYASAVHARWVGHDKKVIVRALAVASEPYIFWRGDGTEEILRRIRVPKELGCLEPAGAELNGPSGIAMDELFLKPLGMSRDDVWLCDLVPHSCSNPAQARAIKRVYAPLLEIYGLPRPTVPTVPKVFADEARRRQIVEELRESRAQTLLLLGDQPIRWFLRHYDQRWRRLSEFAPYGGPIDARIEGAEYKVIALAHPRQAAKLGRSSIRWFDEHERWMKAARGLSKKT